VGRPWHDELPDVDRIAGLERVSGTAGLQVDVPAGGAAASVPWTRDLHIGSRALVTGRCTDVGAITMGQFRGLAARAPYFANGSAKDLRELVDYYDRRFDMRLSSQEKQDLINFLGVL
jgi:cytochrome c peroxidase